MLAHGTAQRNAWGWAPDIRSIRDGEHVDWDQDPSTVREGKRRDFTNVFRNRQKNTS